MKITYLINKEQEDGSVRLSDVTRAEWQAVVAENKRLPADQRRYFIIDYIVDQNEIDRMVIETSFEDYSAWNREHMRAERNRALGKAFTHCSLEDMIMLEDGPVCWYDSTETEYTAEDQLLDQIMIEELRERLAAWRPWGNDLLDLYLDGKKRTSKSIAEKYGVSAQMVCKYKRQFEAFVKNFLAGVSDDASFCEEGR